MCVRNACSFHPPWLLGDLSEFTDLREAEAPPTHTHTEATAQPRASWLLCRPALHRLGPGLLVPQRQAGGVGPERMQNDSGTSLNHSPAGGLHSLAPEMPEVTPRAPRTQCAQSALPEPAPPAPGSTAATGRPDTVPMAPLTSKMQGPREAAGLAGNKHLSDRKGKRGVVWAQSPWSENAKSEHGGICHHRKHRKHFSALEFPGFC